MQANINGNQVFYTIHGEGLPMLLLPNSQLVVFENSGHFPFIEEHDAYLATVRDWLAGLK